MRCAPAAPSQCPPPSTPPRCLPQSAIVSSQYQSWMHLPAAAGGAIKLDRRLPHRAEQLLLFATRLASLPTGLNDPIEVELAGAPALGDELQVELRGGQHF